MSVDPITCHILDTAQGRPAEGVTCQIFYVSALISDKQSEASYYNDDKAKLFAMSKTDKDGRIKNWTLDPQLKADVQDIVGVDKKGQWNTLKPGIYKIKFLTGKYFYELDSPLKRTFFPYVDITFQIENPPDAHYHIPLLLSNHSYTTYRGS